MILLHIYTLTPDNTIDHTTIQVEEREKSYIIPSNPNKRYLKSKLGKIDPVSNTLFTLQDNPEFARKGFMRMLDNQIEAYEETVQYLIRRKEAVKSHVFK